MIDETIYKGSKINTSSKCTDECISNVGEEAYVM
jgi:hypothetical protein